MNEKNKQIKISYNKWHEIGIEAGWIKESAKLEEGGPDLSDIFGDPQTGMDTKGKAAPFSPYTAKVIEDATIWASNTKCMNFSAYLEFKSIVKEIIMKYRAKIEKNENGPQTYLYTPLFTNIIDAANAGLTAAAYDFCKDNPHQHIVDCINISKNTPSDENEIKHLQHTSVAKYVRKRMKTFFEETIMGAG